MVTILIGVVRERQSASDSCWAVSTSPPVVIVTGVVLTLVFSFFFASVAANAIATTARNPVSGMTMLTIIISSVVLLRFGVSGTTGMFFVMAMAGMVCTALSVSGQTITDLKAGYWLGATPAAQEKVKFLGVMAASIAAGLTIILLAQTFQFGDAAPGDLRVVLPSPQASIMKALVEGFMSRQPIAYILFGSGSGDCGRDGDAGDARADLCAGDVSAAGVEYTGVGGRLSVALPQQTTSSVRERAVVIASGLMAGGALGGVLGAAFRLFPGFTEDWIRTPFYDNEVISQIVSTVLFAGLCLYLWRRSVGSSEEL